MTKTTVSECIREAITWGKRNDKPPGEITDRAASNLEEAGIHSVPSDTLLEEFEYHAEEVGYDIEEYE